MDTLCIHLFGRLSILRDGHTVFESLPPKAQELLVYLLLHRDRWHTRERLAAELRAVGSCLTERQGVVWAVRYSHDNPVDAPDVARLSVRGAAAPGVLATAAVAADNQLAPWVDVVEVAVGDTVVLAYDRGALAHDRVRTDAATLAPGVVTGGNGLPAAAEQVDRSTVLACSAGPVP